MNKNVSVSLIIPVYNEKDAILPTIQDIVDKLENSGLGYEVLVVNDGSVDVCKPNCHRKKTIMDRIEF